MFYHLSWNVWDIIYTTWTFLKKKKANTFKATSKEMKGAPTKTSNTFI